MSSLNCDRLLCSGAGCRDNDGPPLCTRDHRAVVLSCSHLAPGRYLRITQLGNTSKGVFQKKTHSLSWASKIYGHKAFQITQLHTTAINSGCTHCGVALWSLPQRGLQLQSWLMPQLPHCLQNDLKCV